MKIYYCVLKNYKGIFTKKHIGNTYILVVPYSDSKYLILGLVGELDEEKTYTSVLVYKVPEDVIEDLLLLQVEDFKWKFEVIEKLDCLTQKISDLSYKIILKEKGDYIKSDIILEYDVENSVDPIRIYTIKGDLIFPTSYIITPDTDMKMLSIKKKTIIKLTLQHLANFFKRGNKNNV